jgi:DNA replication initiation complex subunit (GINS family)
MSDVNITYETLYEMLRNEKNRDDIQKLTDTFYQDVVEYLKRNNKMLEEAILSGTSDNDKEEIFRQIKNIKNLIKELYERREKKILNLAINRSRSRTGIIESDALLIEERELYAKFVDILDCFRDSILNRTLKAKLPIISEGTCAVDYQQDSENIIVNTDQEIANPVESSSLEMNSENHPKTHTDDSSSIETRDDKKLIFKESVQKFLGNNLEVYGPFEANEVATLPFELANILIRKGKAEETQL